ncbi:MAG: two-component regulator propeller domain-containing protein [Flavobacteriales bacterium]
MRVLLFFVILLFFFRADSQVAVGEWRDHLPYRNVVSVVEAGDKIFAATRNGVFIYHLSDNSVERLSPAEGLSDVAPSKVAYSPTTKTTIISYVNGNIDLIKSNRIVNIPAIKNSSIIGDKGIYNIKIRNEYAYLSCGFGIVVIDTEREEVKETYMIGPNGSNLKVNDIEFYNDSIWAATESGIYRASQNSPFLINFNVWSRDNGLSLPNAVYNQIESGLNDLYVNQINTGYNDDTVYVKSSGTWQVFMSGEDVRSIDNTKGRLIFSHNFNANIYNPDGTFIEPYFTLGNFAPQPNQVIWTGTQYFIADRVNGLIKSPGNFGGTKLSPSGPYTDKAHALAATKDALWVASGRVSGNALSRSYVRDGAFSYINGEWKAFNKETDAQLAIIGDSVSDYVNIYIDPIDPTHAFAGTYSQAGLLEFKNGTLYKRYNASNSGIDLVTGSLTDIFCGPVLYDENRNLWVANSRVSNALKVLTSDGTWKSFFCGSPSVNKGVMDMLLTRDNHIWMALRNGGIVAYNFNDTPLDETDDEYKNLNTVFGQGNLPSDDVNCIEEDNNGALWIGTEAGLTVIFNPSQAFNGGNYDAQPILIEQGGNVELLLGAEQINDIKVDGANRKWIATANGGVFLMSADGTEQIHQFTRENSPLLSNSVLSIAINPTNGEVFFATEQGIISYRSDATQPKEFFTEIGVFPNPVHSGYQGPISITGLMFDSDIKITDVSGNLVYRTTSNGGQATWFGNDLRGNRVQTGVYLIFAADKNRDNSAVGKVLFIK